MSGPKRRVTVAVINKANEVFWGYENLRDKESLTDDERGQKLGIEAILNRAKRIAALNGTKNSAKARAGKKAQRDRMIHDAHANGMMPKAIAGDRKIRGKKKLSASQIRRILKAPRP